MVDSLKSSGIGSYRANRATAVSFNSSTLQGSSIIVLLLPLKVRRKNSLVF